MMTSSDTAYYYAAGASPHSAPSAQGAQTSNILWNGLASAPWSLRCQDRRIKEGAHHEDLGACMF